MLNKIIAASALLVALSAPALACDGQVGSVIFNDDFADDSGGWETTSGAVKIVPPVMQLDVNNSSLNANTQDLTFNATDGDYCAEFTLPPGTDKNRNAFGIEFWATDYQNAMLFMAYSDQSVALFKRTAGAWATIFSLPPGSPAKITPNAVNTMRVVSKAGKLTLSVNGQQVKVVRAQVPAGNLKFGVYAQEDAAATPPPMITVKSFNVTAGQ